MLKMTTGNFPLCQLPLCHRWPSGNWWNWNSPSGNKTPATPTHLSLINHRYGSLTQYMAKRYSKMSKNLHFRWPPNNVTRVLDIMTTQSLADCSSLNSPCFTRLFLACASFPSDIFRPCSHRANPSLVINQPYAHTNTRLCCILKFTLPKMLHL